MHPLSHTLPHIPYVKSGKLLGKKGRVIKGEMGLNGSAHTTQTHGDRPSDAWIFDCGATDTMTYDVSDFIKMTRSLKTHIETAN